MRNGSILRVQRVERSDGVSIDLLTSLEDQAELKMYNCFERPNGNTYDPK